MGAGVCVGNVAGHLTQRDTVGRKRERQGWGIAMLRFQTREIYCPAVQPRGRAGLEPAHLETQGSELVGQSHGRQVTGPPPGIIGQADMDQAAHERTGRDDHRSAQKADTGTGINAFQLVPFPMEGRHLTLLEMQIILLLQDSFHAQTIQLFVRLGSRGAHGRPLAGIENAELNSGSINVLGHFATQGIDLLDQMALGQSADGRIAGHKRNGVQIDRQHQRTATHASSRQGRFATGMAGADNDYVIDGFVAMHTGTHVSRETSWSLSDTE